MEAGGANAGRRPSTVIAALMAALLILVGELRSVHAQATLSAPHTPESGVSLIHDHWTVDDGLPVNHANRVHQTPDGYLWLATFDGLVRFDGVRFTVFNAGNTESLPSSRFMSIEPAQDGGFWLSSAQGHLVRFDGGRFEVIDFSPALVWNVYEDGDSLTWIATNRRLYRYARGEVRPAIQDTSRLGPITDLLRDREGVLWLATERDGLWQLLDGHATPIPDSATPGATLFEDTDGTLWAGGPGVARRTHGVGLGPDNWLRVDPADAPWPRGTSVRGARVWDFHREPGGPLWVSTTSGHYSLTSSFSDAESADASSAQRWRLAPLAAPQTVGSQARAKNTFADCPDGSLWIMQGQSIYREGRRMATVAGAITDLHCDHEGSIWATTAHDGLHRFGRPLIQTHSMDEGLGFRNVYALAADRFGGIWFTGAGTRKVGRLHDGAFEHLSSGTHFAALPNPGNTADQVIVEDRDGNLWLGFQVCEAASRRPDGGCSAFTWADGAPRRDGVYAIRQTGDGALWFGTNAGLIRRAGRDWMTFTTRDGLPDNHVRYILESRNGSIYLATLRGGIAHLEPHGSSWEVKAIGIVDGLSSNHVRALHEDADGIIWIATEDRGLNRLDPATGTLARIRQADGLYQDALHQILEDESGRLWMSTNQGLFWVRRAELNAFVRGEVDHVRSIFYTDRDGMRNREANGGRQQSALKASDGRFWFATQDGAVVLHPATIEENPPPPPLVIEQVATARNQIAAEAFSRALQPTPLRLAPDERSFRIAYAAPSFVAPERIRFRYRLEGFDEAWVEAGQRREAVYTNVPPGSYVFRVVGSSGFDVWNEEGAVAALRVAPFVYETGWFRALGALAVCLLLLAGYHVRTRQHRRRRRELERQVEERTSLLRAEKRTTEEQARRLEEIDRLKSRFFTNVSHEFRTPLTLTIGPLEDVQSGVDGAISTAARKKIDLALRNSRRLLRLIGQLLDVARLEAAEMRLQARERDLTPFLRGIARSFLPLAERRRVNFQVQAPEQLVPVFFDAEKLEQVFVNLLSNAFKFTPEGGNILVTLEVDGGRSEDESSGYARGGAPRAVVRVRDNGPGVATDTLPHLFERFYQADEAHASFQAGSGIGLSLAKDLTELHGGTIAVDSAPGFGTSFTVTLLLGRAHLREDQIEVCDTAVAGLGSTAPEPAEQPHLGRDSLLLSDRGDDRLSDRVEGEADTHYSRGDGEAVPLEVLVGDEATEEGDRTIILIADDNAEVRSYVRGHLEPRYCVVEAADGDAALDVVRTRLPDLVVSDVMMPRLDGFALVQAIKADRQIDFIPVILLTAKATEDDKVEGLEQGADDYLTKPFNVRELQARIENLIASRRRLKDHFIRELQHPDPDPEPAQSPAASSASATKVAAGNRLSASDSAFLASVRRAIETHLGDEDFSVEQLASVLNQSRSNLHRRLRLLLDQSPTTLIRHVRLEHAARLIRERRGTISEVAYAVGFKSISHFSYAFKGRYGVAPSGYLDQEAVTAVPAAR